MTNPTTRDECCEHGCNCHTGFIFDADHECPDPDWRELYARERRRMQFASTILDNMAREYPPSRGFWYRFWHGRWPIHHEPLRADARNLMRNIREGLL